MIHNTDNMLFTETYQSTLDVIYYIFIPSAQYRCWHSCYILCKNWIIMVMSDSIFANLYQLNFMCLLHKSNKKELFFVGRICASEFITRIHIHSYWAYLKRHTCLPTWHVTALYTMGMVHGTNLSMNYSIEIDKLNNITRCLFFPFNINNLISCPNAVA